MVYDMQLIGKRLRAARQSARLTQDEVSARVNINEKFLSQIECGKAGLSVPTLLALCNVLRVTPNYVLLPDMNAADDNALAPILQGLTPQQLNDAEELLRIFARQCK